MENSVMTIGNVRGYCQNGVVHLNAEDVARGLGFTQTKNGVEYPRYDRISAWLAEYGFPHRVGKDSFIPENMFYRLAMKANNEAAQKFQAKVDDEILPAIRKTGVYMTLEAAEKILYNPDFIIKLAMQVKNLQAEVAELKPKADYCEKILQSPEALNTTVIAKDYGMNTADFNILLHNQRIQYKNGKIWVLYEPYCKKGYTVFETTLLRNGYTTATQMRWTQKGRMWLYNQLKVGGILPLCERENPMPSLFGGDKS